MQERTLKVLEFNKIKERLKEYSINNLVLAVKIGKNCIKKLCVYRLCAKRKAFIQNNLKKY